MDGRASLRKRGNVAQSATAFCWSHAACALAFRSVKERFSDIFPPVDSYIFPDQAGPVGHVVGIDKGVPNPERVRERRGRASSQEKTGDTVVA